MVVGASVATVGGASVLAVVTAAVEGTSAVGATVVAGSDDGEIVSPVDADGRSDSLLHAAATIASALTIVSRRRAVRMPSLWQSGRCP